MARQEFIQQLSLWDQEDERKETKRKVPIPGQHKTEFFDPFTQTSESHPHLRSEVIQLRERPISRVVSYAMEMNFGSQDVEILD